MSTVKDVYVASLVEGQTVEAEFGLRSRELRSARTGDAYLALELADRTGTVRGVRFRPTADEQAVPVGAVVRVTGRVTSFRGVLRVSVSGLRPTAEYDPADLIAAGVRDPGELVTELRRLRSSIGSDPLRAVVDEVFGDEGFFERFVSCPGARVHHHAYVGGLLEHTVTVAGICQSISGLYDRADEDLLVTAALLHDIGKVDELEYDTAISYSDAGRLLGHVVLGERRLSGAISRLGERLPIELGLRLSHVVLSHHGELEWGAPKQPCVLEALLLHHADNLDAKAAGFIEAVSGAGAVEERWSDVMNLFRRPLYVPRPTSAEAALVPLEGEEYTVRSA